MEAYCMKCKEKREIKDEQAVFTSTGTPATQGVCARMWDKIIPHGANGSP